MNKKTTLVLAALALALVLAWQFLDLGGGSATNGGTTQVATGIDPARVTELRLHDASKERLTDLVVITRDANQGWNLRSNLRDRGQSIRARKDTVDAMLVGLRDLAPLRALKAAESPEAASRFGLSADKLMTLEVYVDGSEPQVFEFGAKTGIGNIVFRRKKDNAVFEIAKEARDIIFPEFLALEDPALFDIRAIDVSSIRAEHRDGRVLELEREFARWWMRAPFSGPGDAARCEEFRNRLLGGRILERRIGEKPESLDPPEYLVTVKTVGQEKVSVLRVGVVKDGRVPVQHKDSDTVCYIDAGVLRDLDGSPGSFRDRHLLIALSSEITGIQMSGLNTLDIVRTGTEFEARFPPVQNESAIPRPLDPVAKAQLLDALLDLKFESFGGEDVADGKAELVLEVTRSSGSANAVTRTKLLISKEDAEKMRTVSLAGQPGSGRVRAQDLAFLLRPVRELLALHAIGAGAYFRIAQVEIIDAEQRTAKFTGSIDFKTQDLSLAIGEGPKRRIAPSELVEPAKARLITALRVREFVADRPEVSMGFDRPHLVVRWFDTDEGTAESIPPAPKGTWKRLVIARREPNGSHLGYFDTNPSLVFRLDAAELDPFANLLRWATP